MASLQVLSLHVGEQASVTLPGLGSAGYQWFATVDDPAVARVERATAGSSTVTPPGPGGVTGSRDERFTVTGVRAGETMVRFTQSRVFERGKPPHATRDVVVRVH